MRGSIAILTQQVSHYHAARYRAASQRFEGLTVVAATNDADFPEFLATDGISDAIRLFDSRSDYLRAIGDGRVWIRINAVLSEISPDVVAVAGWAFPESSAAIDWSRRNDVPVVMMSASQQIDGPRAAYREAVKARIVRMCDAALVGGGAQRDYMHSLGMPLERIFDGYDVVDNDHFESGSDGARAEDAVQRNALGLPQRYLLACSRFIAKKNLTRLVAAFGEALGQSSTPHHLVILGDGPERSSITNEIRVAGLEARVHLPGFQPYSKLPLYYGLSEAFVHVPIAEQWGLVVNEAAASGLPLILSHPCGAARELLKDGENGQLVDPYDQASIACALVSIMLAQPAERAAMGAASRRIVSHWGPDRFANGLARAAEVATAAKRRKLKPWDRLLLRMLSRRYLARVS
jgi:glycosyltransferase involved in cell wall biosynthesis